MGAVAKLPAAKAAVDSSVLVRALGERHADDVFVPECKNGPTQLGSHRRLDAWAMLKTWSPVTTIGYEIKVSRADWRRDQKLDEYAGLCHLLYVVAPKDVVPKDEVPAGVGLLELVGQGRLVTRVKPARREIEMPVSLMVYVLMCRTTIIRDDHGYDPEERRRARVERLREWARKKEDRRALHYEISGKIRAQFDDQERAMQKQEQRLRDLEHIEQRIRELGFDPHEVASRWVVENRIAQLSREIPAHLPHEIARTAKRLEAIGAALTALREPAGLPLGTTEKQ